MIKITDFNENDYINLYDFASNIWFECYNGVIPKGQIKLLCDKYFKYENLRNLVKDKMVYQNIFYNDSKVGFIAYKVNSDHVYLDKLYLIKEFRGKNIAKYIFDYLLNTYKLDITLNVNQNNKIALKCYFKNNFKIVKEDIINLPNGYVNTDYVLRLESK